MRKMIFAIFINNADKEEKNEGFSETRTEF